MKSINVIRAIARSASDTVKNQFVTLHDRSDLVRVYGEQGRIFAIGCNGISEGIYMYLYLDIAEDNELYEQLKEVADRWEGNGNILEAIGQDAGGQTVAVINVSE